MTKTSTSGSQISQINLGVIHTVTELDKIELICAEIVREKPTGDGAVFITYTNTFCFLVYG